MKPSELQPRHATRTVLLDQDGRVAIINVTKHGYYKIPGGGVEDGENLDAAARREVKEETGCDCDNLKSLGQFTTALPSWNMLDISDGFVATASDKKSQPTYDDWESQRGFKIEWFDSLDQAITTFEQNYVEDPEMRALQNRDLAFLKLAKKVHDIDTITQKLAELVETIEDKDLRAAVCQRLKRNSHLVTGAILLNDENKICLVQEAQGPWAGKWNTPLGHMETGETLPTAAKREVKEETGYDIELTALLPPKNVAPENVFRVLYVGEIVGGSPDERAENDTSAVGWFTIEEIEQKLHAGELRDIGTWYDIVDFQNGPQLPLDTIHEAEYDRL